MSRVVVYITNQHPFYLRMAINSMAMLRKHNADIPVRVFLVRDGMSQTIERENVSRHAAVGDHADRFVAGCDRMGVEVVERSPLMLAGEETFFHVNRSYFAECPEESVLYLDADTFIFGDVARLFDEYRHVDFAACRADWALARGWDHALVAKPVGPFSSGVMLWNGGAIRDWCDRLPAYLSGFRRGEDALSRWLYTQHKDCLLREEFSVTKHIAENPLTHSFIEQPDCHLVRTDQCLERLGESLILHCYTPGWKKCYAKLNGRLIKVPLGKIKSRIKTDALDK